MLLSLVSSRIISGRLVEAYDVRDNVESTLDGKVVALPACNPTTWFTWEACWYRCKASQPTPAALACGRC